MKEVAEGVWQLRGFPPNGINVYLVGDVLVDAATRHGGRRILSQLIAERQPDNAVAQFFVKAMVGPGHRVDRVLREGDEVAGFKVLDTPGHSAGHASFWRESDRVLILGDVLNNLDVMTGIPGLREPKPYLTPDPPENRRSIRRLGELAPELVLFGHGAPLRNSRKFAEFCERVPA